MKDIRPRLIELLRKGYCTPQISAIAKKLGEASTTIHYNVKSLEKEGAIRAYKAVFDYKKIGEGFCTYVLINLSPDEYGNPEKLAAELARLPQIESIDIVTGDWEMIIKIRSKDIDAYYDFVKKAISRKGILRMSSLNSLKQVKSEFVEAAPAAEK